MRLSRLEFYDKCVLALCAGEDITAEAVSGFARTLLEERDAKIEWLRKKKVGENVPQDEQEEGDQDA